MLHNPEIVRPFHVVNPRWQTDQENGDEPIHRGKPIKPERTSSQNGIAALPLVTYRAGESVIADGSRTVEILILKQGSVAIVKEDAEIAKVTEPGAVFGELSVLLDQPNKMDVRALETSQFYVADAAVLLKQNPVAAHVTMVLARQLDNANDLQMYRTLPWIS